MLTMNTSNQPLHLKGLGKDLLNFKIINQMVYFFFLLTLLFYFGLVYINLSEPPGGQDGMGYGLALFALGIGFTI
jgi:hypothetical protein